MSAPQMKFGEYLTSRLLAAGVKDIFAVPGDFNLGLLNKFVESEIQYVGCCNELNTAYAADGYARINGIAACITTYAVGELSAINGAAGSYAESVPVIHIVGCPARKFFREMPLLHHTLGDYMTPYKMFERITIDQAMLNDPHTVAKELDRVIKACLLYKRPVYLGVPADMVEESIDLTEGEWTEPQYPQSDPDTLADAVQEIADRISNAKRPVFIPGVELIRRNMQPLFENLTNTTKIPYVTMMLSKGLLSEDHPHFMGLYAGARSREEVRLAVSNSDCVIILGEKLTDFNTGGFSTDFSVKSRIMVNYNNVSVSTHSYNNVYINDVIVELTKRVKPFPSPAWDYPTAIHGCVHRRNSLIEVTNESKLSMKSLFRRLASYVPPKSVVIAETGASMFSAAETMLPDGSTYIGQTFYGSIGFTMGAVFGACMAVKRTDPSRRVVLYIGDGSFQLTCQELSSLIRYKCNPIIFLINNDGYTIERVITDNIYNDIQMWQYHKLPAVFGGEEGSKINTHGELEDALSKAEQEKDKLAFIEVILDKWDCNDLLKNAGRMMALNNNLKPSMPDSPEMKKFQATFKKST